MLQSLLAKLRPARSSTPVTPQAAVAADEWTSLDLDPELASFGAPSVNVEAALAAQQPPAVVVEAQVAPPAPTLDGLALTLLADEADDTSEMGALDVEPLAALSVAPDEAASDGSAQSAEEVIRKAKPRTRRADAGAKKSSGARVSLNTAAAWRLPGVDGTPSIGADDSVERVQFDFSSIATAATR